VLGWLAVRTPEYDAFGGFFGFDGTSPSHHDGSS
jgi:hypothetical protein